MFRRYFQTGDEEDQEGSSGDEEGEQAEQLPPPEEVWGKVRHCLDVVYRACTALFLVCPEGGGEQAEQLPPPEEVWGKVRTACHSSAMRCDVNHTLLLLINPDAHRASVRPCARCRLRSYCRRVWPACVSTA